MQWEAPEGIPSGLLCDKTDLLLNNHSGGWDVSGPFPCVGLGPSWSFFQGCLSAGRSMVASTSSIWLSSMTCSQRWHCPMRPSSCCPHPHYHITFLLLCCHFQCSKLSCLFVDWLLLPLKCKIDPWEQGIAQTLVSILSQVLNSHLGKRWASSCVRVTHLSYIHSDGRENLSLYRCLHWKLNFVFTDYCEALLVGY